MYFEKEDLRQAKQMSAIEFLKRYRKFEQEVRAGADASFQKWFGTEEK